MTDRVKESVFNVLSHRIGESGAFPECAVADLFAGSGGMGLECLSRGAGTCLFVERDRRSLGTLRANIRTLGFEPHATVVCDNAWTLRVPRSPDSDGYRIIFVDPPYRDAGHTTRVIGLLDRLAPRLAALGVIVFRREVGTPFANDQLRALRIDDERTWGRMLVSFLVRTTTDEPDAEPSTLGVHPPA